MALRCAIVTPTEEALDIECDEVVTPGVNGEIGMMPGHIPLVTALHPGVLTVVKGGKKTFYAVGSGFAEIENDIVRVLTNTCEESSAIDVDRAKKKMESAEKEIGNFNPEDEGFADMQRRVRVNRARLNAVERAKS